METEFVKKHRNIYRTPFSFRGTTTVMGNIQFNARSAGRTAEHGSQIPIRSKLSAGDAINYSLTVPQSGAAAVGQSMTIQGQLKEAETLGDALVYFDARGQRQTVRGIQQVGKINFYQTGAVWVQDGYDFEVKDEDVLKIKPFSTAYFELLNALPDLSAALALGDSVYLRHKGQQIVITDDGMETLEAAGQIAMLKKLR